MQRPNVQSFTLNDILITEELSRRISRAPNLQAENQAMRMLIGQMAQDSENLMQSLVDMALELCEAGTTGLSLLETTPDGEEIFRWNALAGTLAHQVGGITPRNFSPCGVCLDQGSPVLFSHPERYFTYFQDANTPIVEGLVLPLVADHHVFGTIWILSHDEQRRFDSEDVRIMTSLADFTATALLLQQRQTKELLAANAALEAEIVERKQTEAQLSEAQRRLELSLEGANLGTWTYRVATDEFWAEDRALHLHGHAPGEVHTFADAGVNIHPVDREQTQVVLAQALRTYSKVQVEYRVIWPDGSVHWIASYAEFMPLDEDEGMFYGIVLDITERKQSEAAIAADLQDTQRLHDLATRFTTEGDIETLYQEIVAAATDLMQADAGTIQILQEETQYIVLLASQGLDPKTVEYFYRLNASSNTACGVALTTQKRAMIDYDVPASEDPSGSLQKLVDAGLLCGQSTPLITRSGKVIGMVSTHWREHYQPSDRQLRFLDLLARQAADLIEQRQAQVVLRESEARLQSIANLVPDLLWDSEPNGSTNWYNQRWMEYTGQTFEQAIGWGWIDAIHPDDREGSAQRYQEAVEQGVMLQHEHRIRRHDGEYRWFVVKASPLKDESGKVVKMYGAATDIHEARISLAALQESEAKYRSLFSSIDEGFAIVEVFPDERGCVTDLIYREANEAFGRHSGMRDFIDKRVSEILPNLEQHWLDILTNIHQTGKPARIENYIAELDRWLDVHYSRVGDVGSRLVAVVFEDITDRKRTEEQQAFLLKFSDALRAEPNADAVANRALQMISEQMQLDRCYIGVYRLADDRGDFTHQVGNDRVPPLPDGVRLSDFPDALRVAFDRTLVIDNIMETEGLTDTDRQNLGALGLCALVAVTLRKGENNPLWSIVAVSGSPRHWTRGEVALLEEITERTWFAIERTRVEAALREAELQRVREQSAREQERQRAESLAELDRTKTLFFSNVSHEFRTPLTLSLAPLQDVLSDHTHPLDPIHRERLELVHRNSLRLLKLVNTLLDFSRMEAGRMEAVYEPTDLALFTAELASVFRSAIEQAGLQLIVDCPPLPELVYVDREMWEKIVLNLLSNAFKFTFEGEIRVSLRAVADFRLPILDFGLENQAETSNMSLPDQKPNNPNSKLLSGMPDRATNPKFVVIEVQDTGTGIAPEHLPHLFERFYQVRGTQARTHEGSGIGLALVHELVRLHHGTLEVSSTIGEGTCFTIALPFGTAHLPSDRLRRGEAEHIASEHSELESDRHPPTHTLASTTMRATTYVEEAERWLPSDDFGLPILDFGLASPDPASLDRNSDQLTNPPKSKIQNPKSKILLVDDNADIREYLTRILGEHVQVDAVADGTTALAVAQERIPDLILSDVMMQGLDGFELLRALRADPRTKEIPIILLSARAGEEAIVEGLEAGADDYLIKPFSAQELISRVTAHLQMAQLRREALQEARSTIRNRDEFISVVSHELNTPLVSILGWTRILRSNPPKPALLAKALDTIERNATLQAKLIQELLDISRIAAGKLRLNLQPIELKPVIETAIATVAQIAAEKSIHLTWQETVAEPIVVMGDGDRLCQVLTNLLTNAIKFTPEFGHVTLELSSKSGVHASDPADAEIRVTDTGIGIAADFLPYVFDRFRQAEGTNAAKGLGLGLAIARHIVELHHGTIHAESPEGQGTTFKVRIPMWRNDVAKR